MHTRKLAIAVCLLAACFRPADGTVPIRCDGENGCPASQICLSGICVDAGDASSAGADMTAIASIGCANPAKGQKLTGRVWACPGSFGLGQARSLCANGWTICTDLLDLQPAACEALSPFFIADVPAYQPNLNPPICATTTIYWRLFAGCGSIPPFKGLKFDTQCTKFRIFALDKSDGYDFSQGHSLDKAISTDPALGVLCCR